MAESKPAPGLFVWRELATDDVEGSRRFLGELFSWTWKGMDMGPEGTYWIASRGDRMVCGLMAKPPGVEMPTCWGSYVLVDDVDAAARRATASGGKVLYPPTDIPDVGRFAAVQDPWGAVLYPFVPTGEEGSPPAGLPPAGTFCWESLVTPDPEGAIGWYRKVIGFGTAPAPSGTGSVFTAGAVPVADIQPARPGAHAHWATHVVADDALALRDRVAGLGGKVLVPRIDVPRVGTVVVIADPAGGALGIFQAGERR